MSYVICRQARHPELALDLLAGTMAPPDLVRFCLDTGQSPPTRAAARAPADADAPFLRGASALLGQARARWALPERARVSHRLALMFDDAILGKGTLEEAVARAATIIGGIVDFPGPQPSSYAAGEPIAVGQRG